MARALGLALLLSLLAAPGAWAQSPEPAGLAELRARLPQLQAILEGYRDKRFQRPVEVRHQSDADFRVYAERELDAQYSPARAEADVALLSALALVPADYDLRASLLEVMTSQVAAYYEPDQGAFFVFDRTLAEGEAATSSVLHELQHALQDQHYDLGAALARFEAPGFDREDEWLAYRFLMEGEATYWMFRYDLAEDATALAQRVETLARMGRKQFAAAERRQAEALGEAGRELREVLAVRERLPNYLYQQLMAPYFKGAAFVQAIVRAHGVAGLDALFAKPPTSTEQILHPEKALGPTRDEPVLLELPDLSPQLGEGARLLAQGTLGEFNLRCLFQALGAGAQSAACAGWDGDRAQVYALPGKGRALVWHLTWDTPQDAQAFGKALATYRNKGPNSLRLATLFILDQDVQVISGVEPEQHEALRAALAEGTTRR